MMNPDNTPHPDDLRKRVVISVLLIVGFACAVVGTRENGYSLCAQVQEPAAYRAEFRVSVEEGYSSTKDGVQFIALQRIDSKEIDRAVLSIDADLPLAKALIALKSGKVRITVEAVPQPEMQRLVR